MEAAKAARIINAFHPDDIPGAQESSVSLEVAALMEMLEELENSPNVEEGLSKWGGRYATYMLAIPAYFMLACNGLDSKSYFLKGTLLGIFALEPSLIFDNIAPPFVVFNIN